MRPPYMPLLPISTDLSNLPIKLALYALIGVLLLVTYGIVGSLYIMHLNPLNSLYFTVQTIATVGFGDIKPVTPLQKIFTITLIMGGVALLNRHHPPAFWAGSPHPDYSDGNWHFWRGGFLVAWPNSIEIQGINPARARHL